jgi:hypothetical protein
MKHLLSLLLLLTLSSGLFAQEVRTKNGFISVTLGAAFPTGDFADSDLNNDDAGFAENGVAINLVNFGYLFSKNIGITAMLSGSAYPIDANNGDEPIWGFGSFMVGPLFSFASEDGKTELDLRVMIGTSSATLDPDDGSQEFEGSGGAFSIGSGLRYNLSDFIALTSNFDIISGNPEFDVNGSSFEQPISTVNLTFGISFRIK